MMKIAFGHPSTHRRTGAAGMHAEVLLGSRRPSLYLLSTHGATAEEFAAKIKSLQHRHAQKEVAIDAMQSSVGVEFTVNEARFRITDAIIRNSSGSDYELIVQIARLVGKEWNVVTRLRSAYGNDEHPTPEHVSEVAHGLAATFMAQEQAHTQFATDVAAALTKAAGE